MYFCFDTETSGLPEYTPRRGYHPPQSYEKYNTSRIVQISWIIADKDLNIVSKETHYIKPDNFIIPEQTIAIHGITNEKAHELGKPIYEVLNTLVENLHLIKTAVAHNVHFDVNILRAECYRYGFGDIGEIIGKAKRYCTMERGKHHMCLTKNPKLAELYEALYDEPMQNAHDAEADTYYCYKCFELLKQMPERDEEELKNSRLEVKRKRRQEHNNTKNKRSSFLFDTKVIELNDEQKNIVFAPLNIPASLILAVAGSGKTTTMVCRIKYLVDMGVPEDEIILTTFTRDATKDMEKKLELVFNYKPDIIVGTMDSLALKYVKQYQEELLKDSMNNVGEYAVKFLQMLKDGNSEELFGKIKYIFIDEFQDISAIQYKIIREFYKHDIPIACVGDDAQNIYTFRGSDIKYILNFENYFENARIYKLTTNYRSTQDIVAFANGAIENNEFQIPKTMVSHSNETYKKPKICFFEKCHQQYNFIRDKILEYQGNNVSLCEIAVLCPQNSFLYGLEELLTKYNIPNTLLDGKSDIKTKIKKGHVCLCTIHKSKGLEWDIVFMIMLNDEVFPSKKEYLDIAESRRLFYVGITRPRKELYITYAPIYDCNYICRFVTEIDKQHYTLHNFRSYCFGKSENSYQVNTRSVTKLIEKLDGEDYTYLKKHNILYDFPQETLQIYKSYTYQDFIVRNDIYTDFGIFLDTLVTRMIAEKYPESNGFQNEAGVLTLSCMKLDFDENKIYQRYRPNFIANLPYVESFMTHIFSNIPKIIKEFVRKDINPYCRPVDSSDISMIINMIRKIYIQSRRYNIRMEEVPIFTEKFLPKDFETNMTLALEKYKNSSHHWNDIIMSIWEVSKCEQIVMERRRRLLYKKITETDILSYTDMYNDMNQKLVDYITQTRKYPKCHETYRNEDGITGNVDLRLDDIILDFKCSNEESIKAEHILQLLCYKELYEENMDMCIQKVGIVNLLKGKITLFDVSDYNKGKELLDFLKSAN
jgi:DNA polymerase III epsilon subunit-like protein